MSKSLKNSVAFWTAVLDDARREGNRNLAKKATSELARLGIRVEFLADARTRRQGQGRDR